MNSAVGQVPDYVRDVQPILSDNCFHCHGADEASREANLRLDVHEYAVQGGDSGEPAIVAGDVHAGELLARITSDDESLRMPPSDSKPRLSEQQVETLRKWIAAGAPYQKHWALEPPQKIDPPTLRIDTWAKNEIDRFVLDRLTREDLKPAAQATPETLLRRLYLDLIGLPPSPEETSAFIADESADAYERKVEELLASCHFGEKWARHWLDVARYADSDGYEKDLPRKQHLWRDWVINAINEDLPYDQFVIEQVAGDLLPNASQDQRVATGFLRNGMVNEEGAVLNEQFRMEGLFDRLDCLGKSILGFTIQCAQCHTHKFDPISHEEYHKLLAFLNNDYEAISWVYSEEQSERIAAITRQITELQEELKKQHPDWQTRFDEWQAAAKQSAEAWTMLTPTDPEWIGGLAHPDALPDKSVITLGFRPSDGDLVLYATTDKPSIASLRFDALTHGDLPFGGPGRSVRGTFAVSEIIVEAQPADDPKAAWTPVKFADAIADFAQAEQPIGPPWRRGDDDKRVVGPAKFLIDGKDETAWGADRGAGRRHQDLSAHLRLEQPVAHANGTRFKVTLRFRHSGNDAHGQTNNFLGRFRLSATQNADALTPLPDFVVRMLHTAQADRTPDQHKALFTFWQATDSRYAEFNKNIDNLWAAYPEGETVLNLAARLPEHHRQTAILDRGNWQKPTTPVSPGVPAALHPFKPAGEPDRLDFANWLVDRRSPTTARVAVNRVWQNIFGIGLVETAEDFGTRASPPSHPEMLDWLAVDFMDNGWSLKHLLRQIVTSATYRQNSRLTSELLDRDPTNRLLARGPRFRVDAEVARDSALTAAGLLNRRVGGPSFFPPVPESMFATSFIVVDFWKTADAPERYRRSLYMFRRRSMPDPVLSSFDAPNGDFSCPRRVRSNTPLAALTALNEPVFVDAARALALRVLREAEKDDRARADRLFQLCVNRLPREEELSEVTRLYRSQRERVADGWLSPRAITTGDYEKLPDLPNGVSPADAAAWTIVARAVLNLDETFTKN